MAISNSRYFLQSANSARAYVLDNNGETLVESPGHKVLTQNVVNNNKKTFYTLTGEALTYIGAVILVVMLVKILRKKR
jgi:apolipoprotein N-acyltransferase